MSSSVPPATSRFALGVPMSPAAGLAMGAVTVVLGILVLAWPSATLVLIAILFGIELVILGAMRIAVGAALPPGTGWVKPVAITLGILTIVAGIICFVWPGATLVVLAIFLGVGWVIDGVASLAQAFGAGRSTVGRVFLIASGIISVIAGLVVIAFPGSSLVALTRVAGVLMIIVGLAQLFSSFAARRSASAAPGTASA